MAHAILPLSTARRWLRHRGSLLSPFKLWNVGGFPEVSGVGPRPRNTGHHRNGVESHLRSASVVSRVAEFAGQPTPRLVRLECYRHPIKGNRHHFSRPRSVPLGVASDVETRLLASLF